MHFKSVLRTCFVLFFLTRGSAMAAPLMADYSGNDYEVSPKHSEASKKSFQKSLSGLYSIETWRAADIQQPYTNFEDLYNVAPSAQQELANLMNEVGLMTSTNIVLPDVKSRERAEKKIATELNGDASKITDLARASLVADDIHGLVDAFELISKEATIVSVKNRFKTPTDSGYRDLKLLVQLPDSDLIAEVQLHLDAISDVKNGEEHKIYEQIQHIERTALSQNRLQSEFETAQIKKLRATSKSLYHDAWQQYLQPVSIAV